MRDRSFARRSGPRLVAVLAIVASIFALVALEPAQVAAGAGASIPMSAPQGMAREDGTGRTFVVGDDKVAAFDADGALVGTVEDVFGGYGIAAAGGSIWVPQTSAGSIAKIDPVTLTKVAQVPVPGSLAGPIAAVGGRLYFAVQAPTPTLVRLDPGSSTPTELFAVPSTATQRLHAISESPPRLRVGEVVYDVSSAPQLAVSNIGSPRTLIGTEVGTFLATAYSPYRIEEQRIVDDALQPTGLTYPAGHPVEALAYNPSKHLIAATSSTGRNLLISRRGQPSTTHRFALAGHAIPRGVLFAPDGRRVSAISMVASEDFRFEVFDLAPTFTGASTTTLRPGLNTTRISGSGLGSITGARFGSVEVVLAHDGPDVLEVEVPTLPAAGQHTLELTGPMGGLSVPLSVEQARVSTVAGRVTSDGVPVAGASVSLVGPLYPEASATTGADGRYSFAASASPGPGYDLIVSKGADRVALTGRSLDGTGPWTFDVDLRRPIGTSAGIRTEDLPPGVVRRLVVDPSSGRVFVSVGDEVVVFAPNGRRAARIADMWSADDLQIVGDQLYVMLRNLAVVARIDISGPSYPISGAYPVERLTTGSIAVAGNRIFMTDGEDQTRRMVSVDLSSGAWRLERTDVGLDAQFAPLDGAPDDLLSWGLGSASPTLQRWNASATEVVQVGATPPNFFANGAYEATGSVAAAKVWPSNGEELQLATLQRSGVVYPTDANFPGDPDAPMRPLRAVARSSGRGGVLAFGSVISRQGAPIATHRLGALPAPRSVGLSPDGNVGYVATEDGRFVVSDLRPLVTSIGPEAIGAGTETLTVSGAGLGGATGVTIDGSAAAFTKRGVGRVDVTVPDLADGRHVLAVTTPWGTSTPVSFRVGPPPPGYAPFASWASFVTRQFTDLTTKAPSTAARGQWVAELAGGTKAPGDLVEALRRGSDNTTNVDPVARLYRAFLGRAPDPGGLRFWIGRKRAGTWSVTRMADSFASSSEFKRKYGTLTNRQFVTRIYTDVLGRPADTAGVNFWTGRLDRKVNTRGQVMVGFSESSEYRRKQAENTDVVIAYVFLLGRAPSSAETASWVDRQKGGVSLATLATELLASEDYRAHAAG